MEKELDKKVQKKLQELIDLCLKGGCIGTHQTVGNYYCSFDFVLNKEKCKECGHDL